MGDRVAVIKRGVLQQVDTPQVLYDEPVNLFVGGFIGSPAMNLVRGRPGRGQDDAMSGPLRHAAVAARRRAARRPSRAPRPDRAHAWSSASGPRASPIRALGATADDRVDDRVQVQIELVERLGLGGVRALLDRRPTGAHRGHARAVARGRRPHRQRARAARRRRDHEPASPGSTPRPASPRASTPSSRSTRAVSTSSTSTRGLALGGARTDDARVAAASSADDRGEDERRPAPDE